MRRSLANGALAVGFLAVAVAVLIARYDPATGYEVSIYAATPTATWIGLGAAFLIALVGAISFRGVHQAVAVALGGLTVTSIVSIPIVRGYRFYGMGDALTHLGWVRDIVRGDMLPHELFYPGLHGTASFVHLVGGATIEHALWLAVIALFVPFVVFVPLIVRDVTGNATAVGVAAVLAWFVLPINNVATHVGVHSNSNALFVAPLVIFAVVAYLRRDGGVDRLFGISPFSLLILLTGAFLLFVHPQQMVNVVVVVAAIAFVQWLVRRGYDEHPALDHPSTMPHAFALGALFVGWTLTSERFRRAVTGLVRGVFSPDVSAGGTVDQRGASLTEIGGSIPELFAKLFLVSALVGLAVALFVLLVWRGRTAADSEARTFVAYIVAALIPLGAMFAIYYVGTSTMAFRQLGFIFVLLTILGGLALGYGLDWLQGPLTTPGGTAVFSVALGAMLVLSVLTIFGSPFIYSPSHHVSDQLYSGYETSLENPGEQPFAGLGYNAYRFDDGLNGVDDIGAEEAITGPGDGELDPDAFNDRAYGSAYPSDDHFLVVTEYDRAREFEVYRGLNHDPDSLSTMGDHAGVNKVLSNEEFDLYEVTGDA